jgi:hypothetical protein
MEEERLLIGIDYATASPAAIELLLEDAYDPLLYEEILKANIHRPDVLRMILDSADAPDDVRRQVGALMNLPVVPKTELLSVRKPPEIRVQTILQKIQKLNVSERIQLALRGGKEIRTILLKDPNKQVSMTVLDNPKITETEIELLARSRSIPEEVLRVVTKKKEWMKSYNVILAMVNNPKAPLGAALRLVSELKTRDLQMLEKNKNVTEGVRSTAKKLLKIRKSK